MRNDVLNFLTENGKKSFDELPFCEGDVVSLALLSYASFEHTEIYKNRDLHNSKIKLTEFGTKEQITVLSANYIYLTLFNTFLLNFFTQERYKDVEIGYFEENFDVKNITQFFAFTIFFKDFNVIVFRGTDTSILGWQEDLELSFKEKIPAHSLAKKYLYKMIEVDDVNYTLIGHSKGGNLAYYAFFNSRKDVKNKIKKVYNLDGPSFKNDKYDYDKYLGKLIKFVPSDDTVGILMERSLNYTIIQTKNMGGGAHDPLNWVFDKKTNRIKIGRSRKLSAYSKTLRITVRQWLEKYDEKEFKNLSDFIFSIAYANKKYDVLSLKLDVIKKRQIYLDKLTYYNKEKKDHALKMTRDFVKIYFTVFFNLNKYDDKGDLIVKKGEI